MMRTVPTLDLDVDQQLWAASHFPQIPYRTHPRGGPVLLVRPGSKTVISTCSAISFQVRP